MPKPDIFAAARERVALRKQLAQNPRPLTGPTRAGGTMLLSHDLGSPKQWRLTTFDAAGEPMGHVGPTSFEDALVYAQQAGDLATLTED